VGSVHAGKQCLDLFDDAPLLGKRGQREQQRSERLKANARQLDALRLVVRVFYNLTAVEKPHQHPAIDDGRPWKDQDIGGANPIERWNADLVQVRPEFPVQDVPGVEHALGTADVGADAMPQDPRSVRLNMLQTQVWGIRTLRRLDPLRRRSCKVTEWHEFPTAGRFPINSG
jgi:hypothetical protein